MATAGIRKRTKRIRYVPGFPDPAKRRRKTPIAISPPKHSKEVTSSGVVSTVSVTTTPPELAPAFPPVRTIAVSTLAELYAGGFSMNCVDKLEGEGC